MKMINGYVFIARFDDWLSNRKILYGKGTPNRIYSPFNMNSLNPYLDKKSAISGCDKIMADNKYCIETLPKRLEMKIAENQRDIDSFQKKSHLIALCSIKGFEGYEFFGPRSIGGPGFDSRCSLEENDFRTFENDKDKNAFQKADHAASEIYRQSGHSCKVALAQLLLYPIRGIKASLPSL